ncbi:MAG: PKD domain-containing protein [Nitrospirae bacterium]|nr:PKD domain-containing protein [Nitrospirota bacterium]
MMQINKNKALRAVIIAAIIFIPVIASFAVSVTYVYDDLNRLTRIIYEDGTVIGYDYDEVGNRQQKSVVFDLFPVANPGGPYSGIEGNAIILNAAGSTDPDGYITLYEWDINNDGIYEYSSSSPTQSHTYGQQGTYTIRLRVTDNIGAPDEEVTTAVISDTSPTAAFTASPTIGLVPLTVNFTNNSTGYDQPLTSGWDFDNNGTIDLTAQTPPPIVYTIPGIYSVRLAVTDSDGSPHAAVQTDYITVIPTVCNLTVTKAGSGAGTVTSSPSGINCGTDCQEQYGGGTVVMLTAMPDPGSTLTGWTGGGCNGTGDCSIYMTADKTTQASFGVCSNQPVRIMRGGSPIYYSTVQSAYNAAIDGDIMQLQRARFTEDFAMNRSVSVTIQGGYDCAYASYIGSSKIKGQMTKTLGTINFKGIDLEK